MKKNITLQSMQASLRQKPMATLKTKRISNPCLEDWGNQLAQHATLQHMRTEYGSIRAAPSHVPPCNSFTNRCQDSCLCKDGLAQQQGSRTDARLYVGAMIPRARCSVSAGLAKEEVQALRTTLQLRLSLYKFELQTGRAARESQRHLQ